MLPKACLEMFIEFNLICGENEIKKKKQYTFYSNPHKSWSCIDMAWMGGEINEEGENIEILPNCWVDHNSIKIIWRGRKRTKPRWTLNTQILKEKECTQKLKKELKFFFKRK
uniref:Endonuclease/exonuclease/phosphatase domain-containing protein n=1 Tax=Micrurus corallinus TaxID=54390 RepID=A0A2D4FV37_MICCO